MRIVLAFIPLEEGLFLVLWCSLHTTQTQRTCPAQFLYFTHSSFASKVLLYVGILIIRQIQIQSATPPNPDLTSSGV